MEEQKKPMPMYFSSLEVENVKSFGEKQVLDLKDSKGALSRWTLILGDNGIGKTTLLKCLAWMMPVKFAEPERFQLAKKLIAKGEEEKWIKEVTKISDKEWEIILNEDPGVEEIKRMTPLLDRIHENDINAVIRVSKGVRVNIQAEFTNDVAFDTIPDEKNLMKIGISLARNPDETLDEIQPISNTDHLMTAKVEEFNAPNLFAYGAARHMAAENLDTLEKDTTYNLLSRFGDLYDAEEVLLKLYNDSLEEDNTQMKVTIERYSNGSANPSTSANANNSLDKYEGKAGKHLGEVKKYLLSYYLILKLLIA